MALLLYNNGSQNVMIDPLTPEGKDYISSGFKPGSFNVPSVTSPTPTQPTSTVQPATNMASAPTAQPVAQQQPTQPTQPTSTSPAAQEQTPQPTTPAVNPYTAAQGYTGPSIVDFLTKAGQPSDFNSRLALATKSGIINYTGTATQNTQLLNTLRAGKPLIAPAPVTTAPSGTAQTTTQNAPQGQTGATTGTPEGGLPTEPEQTEQEKWISTVEQLMTDYGITKADKTTNPVKVFSDAYKEIMTSMGTPTIQAEFERVNKEYADMQTELSNKVQDINDNPWYTEAYRQGKIESLNNRYQGKLQALNGQLTVYKGIYDDAVQQAQFIAGQVGTAYNNNLNLEQDLMMKAIDAANEQLKAQNTLQKTIEVSPGATIYDPNTGEAIYTAPTTKQLNTTTKTTTAPTTGFTPTEKKKLEQAGLLNKPRQEQLNYLYGATTPSEGDAKFYADQITNLNKTFINDDGSVKWSSIPQNIRSQVYDILASNTEEAPPEGGNIISKTVDIVGGTAQAIGQAGASYISKFLNLF